MQREESLTERQSLELIESMISKARNDFSENGHLYLLWGWVVLICSLGQFILSSVIHYKYHYAIWLLTWMAIIYQTIYLVRTRRKRNVKTYTDALIGYVWMSFMITMFLTGFGIGSKMGNDTGRIINMLFLSLYGIPTFLSGIILRFKPLIVGGACCWTLSLIAAFTPSQYHLLLIGAATITAWIVPGYLLRSKYKIQTQHARKKTQ
ncbi:MAG: hypothetical protein WKF89_16930 [Chitinophagaceae bacterium]